MPADIIAFCGCRAAGYQGVILAEWFVYQTSDAYDTVIGYRSFVEHKHLFSKPIVVSDFYSFSVLSCFLFVYQRQGDVILPDIVLPLQTDCYFL